MARVSVSHIDAKDPNNSRSYPGAQGSFIDSSSFSRETLNNNTIAEQVMNSPAYRSAHSILSKENDKSWLQRLEMIPYSVSDANKTSLDDWGLSNNFEDKQDANYQYCMEQISALMAEYQSWKNSLPTTQSQQMADAGINSAITGQGISSSQIPNVGVSSDPSKLPSTNVGDFVNNVVDKFLSLSSGTLDWISKFNEISLNNRRFKYDHDSAFADFVSQLSKDGVILSPEIKSFEDLLKSDDNSWYDSAGARAKRLYNEYTEIRSMDAYGHTIVGRTSEGDYRTGNFYQYDNTDKGMVIRYGSPSGASIDVDDYSKHIADLQYQLWLKDLEYRSEYAKAKKEWHDENGYTNAEDIQLYQSENLALDKITKGYEKEKMQIYVDYLKQLKKESDAGNISSRIQLMDALYDLNSASIGIDLGDSFWSEVKKAIFGE